MGAVQLPDDLQRVIERQIAEGRAVSTAAFLAEAVHRLLDDARLEAHDVRASAQAGIADLAAGRQTTVTGPDDGRRLRGHRPGSSGRAPAPAACSPRAQKFASKEIREEWQRLQAGPRNSGAMAIMEQGLTWQALGLSMVDSQFIESRNFQLRDTARAFDVPPYKLAIEGETEGPAMVQMGQRYLNGPISGYCERWKAKAEQFYERDGDETFLDWDYGHFLKADLLSRFTAYRQAVGGRG